MTASDATKHRVELVINDRVIDPRWQTIIRYALEVNDPRLSELVTRAEAGDHFSRYMRIRANRRC